MGTESVWRNFSDELAATLGQAGAAVVAVHARRRIPSSGVHWRPGIIVTASHTLERREEIAVTFSEGKTVAARFVGRDPNTDLAVLKIEAGDLPVARTGSAAGLKPGNLLLMAARTAEGAARGSAAMVGVSGPAWQTWRGGLVDQTLRLDRNLHPNFSGGAAIDSEGKIVGIHTPALSRFAGVVIPASTVDRVSAELEKKGHVGRGFLGVGMQAVWLPEKLREALKVTQESGVMIVGVEPESPADKAGVLIGDILLALDGTKTPDLDDVQMFLAGDRIGKAVKSSLARAGSLVEVVVTVGERPRG